MNKLTQEQIKELGERRSQGESTYKLAKEFGVVQSTVCYHTDKNTKKRNVYASRKEYLRSYAREKYKNDEEFREKHKERCRKNKEKKE